MSWPTPIGSVHDNNSVPVEEWATPGELEEEDYYEITWETRVLSHRDAENLGMWAAGLKLMAGTQDLLPAVPLAFQYARRRSRDHSLRHPHSFPFDSRPSAPPASPRQPLPARVFLAGESSARGVIYEASMACNRIMQLASSLERRTNAERRLSRKNRRPNRSSQATVGHGAPASTPPDIVNDSRCRTATPRPPPHLPPANSPHSPQPPSVDLVGVITAQPTPPPLEQILAGPLPPSCSYLNVGTDPHPPPAVCDAAIDALPQRTFVDTAVCTSPAPDDHSTSYGIITDPFARSLARILPLNYDRERRFSQTIYLQDWVPWFRWLNSGILPPIQRLYINALAEIFRPGIDPEEGNAIALSLNPVYNLFTHYWSGWNALTFPTQPAERNPFLRYDYVSDDELHGEVASRGRGFIVWHASGRY
ncbi:hypothetical protein C8J57DRAFT_1363806 [Mycena rebaudengoi]|nr:hypothetical protein C8J57DRAFT_1363806 [Mycena rebaudengoi]